MRFPAPLAAGGRIGVTAPSSGVPKAGRRGLNSALQRLRETGYDVVVGDCLDGHDDVSAPAAQRAAELTAMICDPTIAVVVAACGGELAVELLPHLDFQLLADAPAPPWIVGFSDISTLLLPVTLLTTCATLHADNLIDSLPGAGPAPLASWLDAVTTAPPSTITQSAWNGGLRERNPRASRRWRRRPSTCRGTQNEAALAGVTSLLDPNRGSVYATGRLIGGCLDTISVLAGTKYGNVAAFAAAQAPEGLMIYLETAEHPAFDVARDLWRLRLAVVTTSVVDGVAD